MEPPRISRRQAGMEDLDSIVDLMLEAMADDALWNYRFPYRKDFPEDHRNGTRLRMQEFLAGGQWLVNVAEIMSNDDPKQSRPIAFAVWNLPHRLRNHGKLLALTQPPAPATRRDAKAHHIQTYTTAMEKAKERYFKDGHSERQLTLQVLGTHPKYRRRGAATVLCKWGLGLATERDLIVLVFASPMGRELYDHLSFDTLGRAFVKVDGDPSEWEYEFTVMKWEKAMTEVGNLHQETLPSAPIGGASIQTHHRRAPHSEQ